MRQILGDAVADDFDARHGTDTARALPLWRLAIPSRSVSQGVGYATARETHIRVLLEALPKNGTFLDLGCGKGRILIIAAEVGFRTIIGVEFAPRLAQIAVRNLAITRQRATVLCQDVRTYHLPSSPLVIYLYDPFDAPLLTTVVDQLRVHPHPWTVVYVNPRCLEVFAGFPRLPLTEAQRALFSPASVALIHGAPSGA